TAEQLREMGEALRAGELLSRIQQIQEQSLSRLQDREALGDDEVKLGRHTFAAHKQSLGLSLTPRNEEMCLHLSGTAFFQPVYDEAINAAKDLWQQSLISENDQVYRAEYLAYALLDREGNAGNVKPDTDVQHLIEEAIQKRPQEGYVKGVHDADTHAILTAVVERTKALGSLRFAPRVRVLGRFCYEYVFDKKQKRTAIFEAARQVPGNAIAQYGWLIDAVAEDIAAAQVEMPAFADVSAHDAAVYLFEFLTKKERYHISRATGDLYKAFQSFIKKTKTAFTKSLQALTEPQDRFAQIQVWVNLFLHDRATPEVPDIQAYGDELAFVLMCEDYDSKKVTEVSDMIELEGMHGSHALVEDGHYAVNYHHFMQRLGSYYSHDVPRFEAFRKRRHALIEDAEAKLKPARFQPEPMAGFVRNRLIDRVYLPLIGENLAKQLGTVSGESPTDRQGMLLLISPPGYGKTTLMEYVADRLGLFFAKINGPSLGHEVTSLDPAAAPNAAAREELIRLNLALAMGDNVMLYLDDIQHCNPELLQKFIPLADANRRIEGVWDETSQTFDMRGRRFCVVMAGNPYTESGDQFQIPDMLANRADTYNLGDMSGEHQSDFELSYIENALSSHAALRPLRNRPKSDVYTIIEAVKQNQVDMVELSSPLAPDAMTEVQTMLRMLLRLQSVVLGVNQRYIASAAQADEFRTEPAFRLQGSYRNMARLTAQLDPIMNEDEVESLLFNHYSQEAQTLTNESEANLLKFKEMVGTLSDEDAARWELITETFRHNKLVQADRLGQMAQHLEALVKAIQGLAPQA
ncbi:MAG: ATP-binding protein, partial [Bacteroidia bacterium]